MTSSPQAREGTKFPGQGELRSHPPLSFLETSFPGFKKPLKGFQKDLGYPKMSFARTQQRSETKEQERDQAEREAPQVEPERRWERECYRGCGFPSDWSVKRGAFFDRLVGLK